VLSNPQFVYKAAIEMTLDQIDTPEFKEIYGMSPAEYFQEYSCGFATAEDLLELVELDFQSLCQMQDSKVLQTAGGDVHIERRGSVNIKREGYGDGSEISDAVVLGIMFAGRMDCGYRFVSHFEMKQLESHQ
jgi:hypothetical protein